MAQQSRVPTYVPIRQWDSGPAARAQNDVYRNNALALLAIPGPGPYVVRTPTYAPIRQWSSAEAIRAQPYINILGTNIVTAPIPRSFDYSVQPSNRLSSAAIRALADNYTNLVINTVPSPIIRSLDYSVQPWNGAISRAAVSAWVDNYANRLANGFLANPTALPQRNFDYSVQPWNKLSAAAVRSVADNYVNRLVILPEPDPLPPRSFDFPIYPASVKISSAAVNAWADNYANRLADGLLPFVRGPGTPIARLPVPATPITVAPGLEMDRVWYRFFDSLSRRVTLLEEKNK